MTLRIQKSAEGESVIFTLTGRIQEEQVAELQKLFQSWPGDHNIVLDLKDVKLVDLGTVRFLAHREAKGMRLVNCPAYVREWILQEMEGTRTRT